MSENESEKIKSTANDAAVEKTLDSAITKSEQNATVDQGGQAGTGSDAAPKTTAKKRKKTVSHVLLKVTATFNNTKITVTDASGNTLAWASAGQHFKGSRKRTPFAAETAAQSLIDKLRGFGVRTIDAVLKGAGPGRDAAVKPFGAAGFQVLVVRDATPVPHNGCRPPKVRRT